MPNPLDTFADRHPAVTRATLTVAHVAVVTVPAATILAVTTGHTGLAIAGVFAGIGFYATGYAAAALRHLRRIREEVARARRDPLTGLPNRAVADETLADAARAGAPMTVALIDVDGLNMINSSVGHAGGDQYVAAVARRLARAVPPDGVLVRQGGDEFTLLAPGVDPQQLAVDIGAALAGPAVIAGYRLQPRASVGIAATDGAADASHARARADSAMYTAKLAGGNQILVFDPDRDPEPLLDGTRPLLRRRDINPLAETGVVWAPALGDELIPVLLAPDDLRVVAQALSSARDRWARAATEAATEAAAAPSDGSGSVNIEPTAAGYAGIAALARQQQARLTRLIDRLRPIIDAVDALGGTGHGPAAAPALSCVLLSGISAVFTPAEIEALVITAADAVYGQGDDLSSRQRELAARAYHLLHADDEDVEDDDGDDRQAAS
jgi:diguanylate cyclase (GGDEF)-like protein